MLLNVVASLDLQAIADRTDWAQAWCEPGELIRELTAARSSVLIDKLLPSWDFNEVHGIDVAASPERTWTALEQVTMGELPLARLLTLARGIGRRASMPPAVPRCGRSSLRWRSARERVTVIVARPWRREAA